MNIQKYSLFFLVFLSFNLHPADYQLPEDTLGNLCKPVKTTASGFAHYIKNVYNNPLYASDVLPNNFDHCKQLLEHAKVNNLASDFPLCNLQLFTYKAIASPYVNIHAFEDIVGALPHLLQHYCTPRRSANLLQLQENVNKLFLHKFKNHFSDFQKSPTTFFNELSGEIIGALGKEYDTAALQDLQKTALMFLEVSLSKLMWCPEDGMKSWYSVKSVSEKLVKLLDANILANQEDLNLLFVTLLERYCFFLDIARDRLPSNFFETLKFNVETSGSLMLFDLEEQEALMESKKERILRCIASYTPSTPIAS